MNTCFSPVRSPVKDGCTMSHNKGVSAKNYSEDSKEAHEAYAGSIRKELGLDSLASGSGDATRFKFHKGFWDEVANKLNKKTRG